jgi:hypothetical protein
MARAKVDRAVHFEIKLTVAKFSCCRCTVVSFYFAGTTAFCSRYLKDIALSNLFVLAVFIIPMVITVQYICVGHYRKKIGDY